MLISFGFIKVGEGQKQVFVDDVFYKVVDCYDLMNDLMFGGFYCVWKDVLVFILVLFKLGVGGWWFLDGVGGIGDIVMCVVEKFGCIVSVVVCDINDFMLGVGWDWVVKVGLLDLIIFFQGNVEELLFFDNSFDVFMIVFGICNVLDILKVLCEVCWVLKWGGCFLCFEFFEVDVLVFDKIYDVFFFNVILVMGWMVIGDGEFYCYFVELI